MKHPLLSILSLVVIGLSACGPLVTETQQGPQAPATVLANPNVILATTTSTQDSGLLDVLVPEFQNLSGYVVQVIAVGTGEAIKMGEQGNADVLLVHAPSSEKTFMENGFGSDRRLVMHNDFILVGPEADPAGIKASSSVVDALEKITTSGSAFVSRGDDSGTHKAELKLWTKAEVTPEGQPWYIETGQGMGATLTITSELGAYTLTDRATFLANLSNLQLAVLFEGDTSLLNVYHVIIVNPDLWPSTNFAGATAFSEYITSPDAQAIIDAFGVEKFGQQLFVADATKTDAELGLP